MELLYLFFQLADVGLGAAQVFLHAGFFFLELAEQFFQLGNVLTRSVQLLLGLCTLIGKRRLEQMGKADKKDEVKQWYDGFTFGRHTDIYNPWSVINFFDQKVLDDYWINTSGNSILNQLMLSLSDEKQQDLLSLLRGESISAMIREGIIYDEIGNDEDALYTMLLTTGYLTPISCEKAFGGYWCELVIPNREIQKVWKYGISFCGKKICVKQAE